MSEPALFSPVAAEERLAPIDVLRGVALLGILTINVWSFALPEIAQNNPRAAGGATGAPFATWVVCHLLFEQKMMSIFSMLFGAGLVLQAGRADARGAPLAATYYRRVFWLLVIGLLHAYLLWDGDILVSYALCGLFLYPLRRLRPGTQIALGICVFLLALPPATCLGWVARHVHERGGPEEQREWLEEVLPTHDAREETIAKEVETYRGGYGPLFVYRAGQAASAQTFTFVMWAGPRAGGLMLVGMGLMRLGVLAAARSFRFYATLAAAGYGVGLPVVGYGAWQLIAHDFEVTYELIVGEHFNYVGSLFVALGHVGVVMMVCQAGALPWLTARLAAVGRMALTNYLTQTLLCTTLFYGYGFGVFGRLDRFDLLGVVAAVWLLQLAYSPLWLRHLRFGPAEWLWRSLTYGKMQPMRGIGEPGKA